MWKLPPSGDGDWNEEIDVSELIFAFMCSFWLCSVDGYVEPPRGKPQDVNETSACVARHAECTWHRRPDASVCWVSRCDNSVGDLWQHFALSGR